MLAPAVHRANLHARCNGPLAVSLQILPSLPDSTYLPSYGAWKFHEKSGNSILAPAVHRVDLHARCNGVTALSRSLYKSCPACQIPLIFHLTGHGNSTKKVEIPFWRQLYIERTYMRGVTVDSRRGLSSALWNFHFFPGISTPRKMDVIWNLAGWAGFVERP
jgi:hypothetical protein